MWILTKLGNWWKTMSLLLIRLYVNNPYLQRIKSRTSADQQIRQCQCIVLIVIFRLQLKQQQWLEFTADLGSVLGSVPFSHSAHFVAASGICSPFTNSWMSNTNAHTVKGFWGKAISIHGSNLPIQLQVPCVHVPSSETIINV